MVRLMDDPKEAETRQDKGTDQDSVELIEAPAFSEKTMSGFVKADENAVHQMTYNKHERHRQPDQSAMDR
jgi:hypothetical protein